MEETAMLMRAAHQLPPRLMLVNPVQVVMAELCELQ